MTVWNSKSTQMKPKVNVNAQSVRKALAELHKFGKEAETIIDEATEAAAELIRDKAIVNINGLGAGYQEAVGEVAVSKADVNYYTINVQGVPLAAYIEFGTGAYVEVPPEWKGLAWNFYETGKGTLPPNPYLYPAFIQGREQYQKQLEKAIEALTKKYS